MKKEIGIVGLGKMGANMARRMIEKEWKVVGMDVIPEAAEALRSEGVSPVGNYKEMAEALSAPRLVWLFVPSSQEGPVNDALFGEGGILENFSAGDLVIDGGNSFFKLAKGRAEKLTAKGIHYMDIGTSGGPQGARNGACLMIGGAREDFERAEEFFRDFAQEGGYAHVGPVGAGHFVKMVHNGIEYGMMQAIGEGFDIMHASEFHPDLEEVARIYNHGSVIESRLVGWLYNALRKHGTDLEGIATKIGHSGEGKWTAETAKEMGIDAAIIEESYRIRVGSSEHPTYAGKVVNALRNQFGGHQDALQK
ncbi:MAG: decarboxylating 6-phosphogluconate dehydrogenase [Patescibacteria group bacterium]|nr:decarboxylating 6-phosphogluconate dehydrogenase [Patescibacteria group bacterium]